MPPRDSAPPTRRIAVVGAGISGLAAAWMLGRRYSVTLYEANDYLGGHTNTVDVTLDGVTAPVDTGFLVFNERTYPELIRMFGFLGVESVPSEMSFSVSVEDEGIEWSGTDLAALFAWKRNALKPAFWTMLADMLRFNQEAARYARTPADSGITLGEFLERGRYGRPFRDWYLLPMSGAIWSCPTDQMLEYPMHPFARFLDNHGLLRLTNRPLWRTVAGGGRQYVKRLAQGIADIRLATPVSRVVRDPEGIYVAVEQGAAERFDHVVFACHSDQALRLLADPDATERRLVGAVKYQPNCALLHTDASLLPRARRAWSAWNYHAPSTAQGGGAVGVSYLINRLQPLPFTQPVIVTLNPHRVPDPAKTIAEFSYSHPMFDRDALAAQRSLAHIQGRRRTWFCGAWTGYGFHEDGLRSALSVADALGVRAPWRHAGLELAA